MSDIDALRQRVEAAEQSFGLIDERDRNYSARLISLISGIEGQLRQHQAEVAERDAQLGRLERENGELRALLHSLLLAVEDGGKDRLGDTVNSMDQRVTALLAGEQAQAEPAIDLVDSAAPGEPAAADDEAGPDTAATTPNEVTAESDGATSVPDETSTAPDAVARDAAEPTPEPDPEDAPATIPEATSEPEVTAEAASAGAADEDAVGAPPEQASAGSAEESVAGPAAEDAGDLVAEDAGDESLGEELLATLEDVIDDAPAEATGSDAPDSDTPDSDAPDSDAPGPDDTEDPIELDIEAEGAPDQEEAQPEPTEAEVEAPADDTAALDEILSGAPTTDHTTGLEAEQPTIGALEGTDVVMVGWDADDAPDDAADGTDTADPELAERAEKIAALLSSGDESDPSVKEIIEKVTELAASLSSEPEDSAGDVDPTAETMVEAIAAPGPAAEEVPQATSAA